MKKQMAAALLLLCLAPASGFAAVSAKHFEHGAQYQTTFDTTAPPIKCPAGQVVTYRNNAYSCTNSLDNPCWGAFPNGGIVMGINPDGTPQCVPIHGNGKTCDTGAGQVMTGVTSAPVNPGDPPAGTPICSNMSPPLSCTWTRSPGAGYAYGGGCGSAGNSGSVCSACPAGTWLMNMSGGCSIGNEFPNKKGFMIINEPFDNSGNLNTAHMGCATWGEPNGEGGVGAVFALCCHFQ